MDRRDYPPHFFAGFGTLKARLITATGIGQVPTATKYHDICSVPAQKHETLVVIKNNN